MAFIDFTFGSAASYRQMNVTSALGVVTPLSDLENAAADIGAHDHLSSVRDEGSLLRLLRAAFAMPRPAPLADPRLEAIRRLAVVAHLGVGRAIDREARQAVASGVSASKALAVLARFGRSAGDAFGMQPVARSARVA